MAMTAVAALHRLPTRQPREAVEATIATGLPPHVHAIGDKGNRIILDVYEKLLAKHKLTIAITAGGSSTRRSCTRTTSRASARLKLVAEINPYHVSDDMRWMEERIGRERSQGAYAFRKLKDAGAVLIFGSDSPGTNAARYFLNPVYGLYAAVSRQTLAGRAEGRLVPGSAADHRGSDRGLHEGTRVGVVRRGCEGNARARQATPTSRCSTPTSSRWGSRTRRSC